ncbi:hypothetical protein [Demequina mangrovi]|uniref:Leucine rich repeat variant n=1 Tax=Demequina mangrovi TaxID=1043493 RepID=A0A1H6WHI9_9MICO|nr:hypothetical protein [Demequina mangrovi]SEJ16363.1 hypothetical protein SAMN05421637_1006 [Demequina mangrovi]
MARGFNYAPGASDEVQEASDEGLSKERMLELGGSRNAVVREAIAARPDCPFGLMVTLAHDSAPPVRAALAANPRVLQSLLEHLSRDRQETVLIAAAGNPTATSEILDALAGSRKAAVRDAAVAALDAQADRGGATGTAPELLRDQVFERSRERRDAMLAERAAAAAASEEGAEEESAPKPVRTAPVRGFLPPVDA